MTSKDQIPISFSYIDAVKLKEQLQPVLAERKNISELLYKAVIDDADHVFIHYDLISSDNVSHFQSLGWRFIQAYNSDAPRWCSVSPPVKNFNGWKIKLP